MYNWIYHNKNIRFNMFFFNDKDFERVSTFHYYWDGVFPTANIVLANSERRFYDYCTPYWCWSTIGNTSIIAPYSFLFTLTNQKI